MAQSIPKGGPAARRGGGSSVGMLRALAAVCGVLCVTALLALSRCSSRRGDAGAPAPSARLAAAGAASGVSGRGSGVWDGAVGLTAPGAPTLKELQEYPFCKWLRTGADDVHNELSWGKSGALCRMDHPARYIPMGDTMCYSCATGGRVCGPDVPKVQYHTVVYIHQKHPEMWNRSFMLISGYLMTQDRDRSHLTLWTYPDDPPLRNANTTAFLDHWVAAGDISIRQFDYNTEVQGTPLEGDVVFGEYGRLRKAMVTMATYTDVVRLLLLHNYGGAWMDYDVLPLRDLSRFLAASYQITLRWTNNPFMYYHARSPLIKRLLAITKSMPPDAPNFEEEVIKKRCKPLGYFQSDAPLYKFNDIYNTCLLRIGLKTNNTLGQHVGPEGLLVDLPLSWFDDWVSCYNLRHALNDTRWATVAGTFLTMHTHFFKNTTVGAPTALGRYFKIVDSWFAHCNTSDCMPRRGLGILAYEGAVPGSAPVVQMVPPPKARLQLRMQRRRALQAAPAAAAAAAAAVPAGAAAAASGPAGDLGAAAPYS